MYSPLCVPSVSMGAVVGEAATVGGEVVTAVCGAVVVAATGKVVVGAGCGALV